MLAVFDPARLSPRASAQSDWWCADVLQLDELQTGALALVGLGGDGVYRIRVTSDDLTRDERDYAASVARGLGVEVISRTLFVGPAECLPGGGSAFAPGNVQRGLLVAVDNGRYDVDLFAIDWLNSSRWWREDHSVPEDAPVDIVAVVRPRSTPFSEVSSEPRLDFCTEDFLFESTTRRVGPEPGMVLTTKVRRGPSNDLCLKGCGPCGYSASLVDNSGVAWKDTIRLKILSVDHGARKIVGELVGKVEER